jgi:hypothetical protein
MHDYFLRVTSSAGRMTDLASFLGVDDASALAEARILSDGRGFMLTRRGRTIRCPATPPSGVQHLAAE